MAEAEVVPAAASAVVAEEVVVSEVEGAVEEATAVARLVAVSEAAVEIDLQRYRRAATLVATDRAASVDREVLEIDPVASVAREASAIGQAASAGQVALGIDPVALADREASAIGRVASVDQEVSATDLESAIDLESVIGSRTPATDTTFGRTPTTTGITGTGTAIGALGASALWPGV